MDSHASHSRSLTLYHYWDIYAAVILGSIAFYFHQQSNIYLSTTFAALTIVVLSITVSEVAEVLAERLGEPYGSYILTFSAVAVEIILLFNIILHSAQNPDALDTVKGGIISAVIVDMNVLLGLAVFIGGLSYKEQEHNEDTSSSYTTILYVSSIALLVPSILSYTDHGGESLYRASMFISGLLILFYITILIFQTKTHTHFFKATAKSRIFRYRKKMKLDYEDDHEEEIGYFFDRASNGLNFFFLFVLIALIGVMAEIFAVDGLKVFTEYGISAGIAGLVIAIISVTPEIFTAINAAKNDQIQRVVNIAMGASTVSILLTVPILMLLSHMVGIQLALDFNPLEVGALIFTIILAWKTTDNGETNYFEGISHLMLFLSYAVIAGFY